MPTYAVIDDLTERFPRAFSPAEDERAETLLGDASFWLSVWAPGLDAAVNAGNPDAIEAAMLLTVAMVKRALLTPGMDGRESESSGVYQVRYRNPEGNLFVYGRELESILSLLTSDRSAAVSMRSPGL
jgi:hypothetical protein